jgi:hypothetical protein
LLIYIHKNNKDNKYINIKVHIFIKNPYLTLIDFLLWFLFHIVNMSSNQYKSNNYNKNITNLSFLIDQLRKYNWNTQYTNEVLDEYEKFLYLRSKNSNVSPSNDVDVVWHVHILNTKHYRNYCNTNFGQFIDHDPQDAFDQNKRQGRLVNTITDYTKKFGIPNAQIWPPNHAPHIELKTTVPKKLIWYSNPELSELHKQNKPVNKIIFTISGGSQKCSESVIMYLFDKDMTLLELSKLIDNRLGIINNHSQQIRFITKNANQSHRFKSTKQLSPGSRHITDIEPDSAHISYYYKNKIELIAQYSHPNEGC